MKTILALLLATSIVAAAAPRPNVVLIMADDLGFADIGCYGSEIETPNLDSLAKQGLRFTQFYNTAKCHSSRVSLLTGLYCDQAGGAKLSRGATIAEVLKPAGYHTMMVGKWHLNQQPTDFGFERYWGHLSGATNFFTGDNTLILFCSDNGACPFDRTRGKDKDPWDPASYWCYDTGWAHMGNTPFRLYKQNQHQGGISSPLIARIPDAMGAIAPDPKVAKPGSPIRRNTPTGTITDQPGHLIDFMATCIDLSGADYPKQIGSRQIDPLQGKSLLPILKGEARTPHEQLYFHFGTDRALRQGDWKLVSAKAGRWELYDLAKDPTELNELAGKNPERVKRMSKEWFRVAKDVERLSGKQLKPVSNKITPLFQGKRDGKK